MDAREPILTNSDVTLHLAAPKKSLTDYFYKNTDADELIFIHKGSGVLRTFIGNIEFVPGDYLLIPRGMIYQISFNDEHNRHFITESFVPIYSPKTISKLVWSVFGTLTLLRKRFETSYRTGDLRRKRGVSDQNKETRDDPSSYLCFSSF